MNKEVKGLIDKVNANGFRVITAGSSHYKVLDKAGDPVVDSAGPVIIPASPSNDRWIPNTMTRLVRAGVLEKDENGKKPKNGGTTKTGTDADTRQQLREREEQLQRERQARTKLIRERIETLVVKMGGWDRRGTQQRLGDALFAYAESNKLSIPSSKPASAMMIHSIKKGGTLSLPSCEVLEPFLAEVEKTDDHVAAVNALAGFTEDTTTRTTPKQPKTASTANKLGPHPAYTDDQKKRVGELIAEGKSHRETAKIVFGSEDKKSTVGRISKILKEEAAGTRGTKKTGRPATPPEEVAFAASCKHRFTKIFDRLQASTATEKYEMFWRNGQDLTPTGEPYPGMNAKTDEGSKIIGIDHVRALARGQTKTINKDFHKWWDRNLADMEEQLRITRTTDGAPAAGPSAPPESTPEAEPTLSGLAAGDAVDQGAEPDDTLVDLDLDPGLIGPVVAAELANIPPMRIDTDETPTLALRSLALMIPKETSNYPQGQAAINDANNEALAIAREILTMEINTLLANGTKEDA